MLETYTYWLYKHIILAYDKYVYEFNDDITIVNKDGLFNIDLGIFENLEYYNITLIPEFISAAKTKIRYYFDIYPKHIELLPKVLFDEEKLEYYVEYENCLILKRIDDKILHFPQNEAKNIFFLKLISNKQLEYYSHIFNKYDLQDDKQTLNEWKNDVYSLFLLND